jgi:hypothetical protein
MAQRVRRKAPPDHVQRLGPFLWLEEVRAGKW